MQKSQDVIAGAPFPPAPDPWTHIVVTDMTAMIQGLSADFAAEIKTKQDSLDVTQAHLRAATRELSEQRKQNPSVAGALQRARSGDAAGPQR